MAITLIIFGILLYVILSSQVDAQFEEDEEEDRIERINNIRRLRIFAMKQRLKGARQWHSQHN